jgi:sarcosine oxidase delta subunit
VGPGSQKRAGREKRIQSLENISYLYTLMNPLGCSRAKFRHYHTAQWWKLDVELH